MVRHGARGRRAAFAAISALVLITLAVLIPSAGAAVDFYWEEPERLSRLPGTFPQAHEAAGRVVVIWQENQAQDEGGQAWLSAASYGPDGVRRSERFAGPVRYRGDAPQLFSAKAAADGTLAVALATGDRSVGVYYSSDGGLSFRGPTTLSLEQTAVAPRIFPSASGGWLLFMTRGESDALSIVFSRSDDGLAWDAFRPFVAQGELRLNFLPTAAAIGDTDLVVFQSLAGGERPSFQLFSMRSRDGGRSWDAPRLVTDFLDPVRRDRASASDFDNQRPHLGLVDGEPWLAWERRVLAGAAQAYAARLLPDGSVAPGSVERVSLGQGSCSEPRVLDLGGTPALSWFDDRTGSPRVYLSYKDGFLWRERELSVRSRGEATFGRAVFKGGSLWAFWQLGRGANAQVVGMAPDVSVDPPELIAVDFRPGEAAARSRVNLRWTVPRDSSGIAGFSYLWSRDPDEEPPETVMALETLTRSTHDADEDGDWFFSVRAQDYAGNWSRPARVRFVRDTTPPSVPIPLEPEFDARGFIATGSPRLRWLAPPEPDLAGYSWVMEYLGPLDRPPARRLPAAQAPSPGSAVMAAAASAAPAAAEGYSFLPITPYEERLWTAKQAAFPQPSIRTREPFADFTNLDDGFWALSIAAIDRAGNMGDAIRILIRNDKYRPFTQVSDVVAQRDDFGTLRLRLIGRNFLDDGPVARVVIDADGREPWDRAYELRAGDYTIRSDRLIEGLEAAELPAGTYRVGLFHAERGWFFTRPLLTVDVSGTVKFGDFSQAWRPSWTFFEPGRRRIPLGALALMLGLGLPLLGALLSLRQVALVIREGQELRLDALALLEGKPMPSLERERAVKAAAKRGTGLALKFIFTISMLVLFVVGLVSVPIGLQTLSSQSEILARGLEQRARVLLESAAQGGRAYLPVRSQLELATLPAQAAALDEALYLTLTGYGSTRRTDPDIVWASNDPGIGLKIDTPALRPGESALADELSPLIADISASINERARERVGELAAELQRLQDEAVALATRLDEASQRRADELSASAAGIQRELNARLAAIADASVASVPAYDPAALGAEAKEYIFYKPILYRQGREDLYYRGMVRLAVSTEIIVKEVAKARAVLLRNVAIVAAVALAIGVAGAALLSSIIIRPVRRLVDGIRHIRDTADKKDLEGFVIDVKSGDEIGLLSDTVNDMTMGLVIAAKEAEFLTVGKETQKMFIPLEVGDSGEKLTTGREDNPTHSYFGYYEGAKGVSGDYFDYRRLDDRHWAFIKCDVSGKGIPAALIMVGVATIFSSDLQAWNRSAGIHLDQLAYKINDFLNKRGFKGRFAAFTMGIYDSQTGALYICHAGDNRLYIYSAAERRLKEEILEEAPAAGPIPNDLVELKQPYKQVIRRLDPGDVILLFTDGFEESVRIKRTPDYKPVIVKTIKKGPDGKDEEHEEEAKEDLGQARINDAVSAIMSRGRFSLKKEDDPLGPDISYDFDFSSCEGSPEDLVMGLAAIEKVFRLVTDPSAGPEDLVLADRKVDAMLERCFVQYNQYYKLKKDHPDKRMAHYRNYVGIKEDEQYDDLTMLAIKRNT